jgi:UDP-N-acetylmuramoyl-L-alanine---L-glutamate ligase
MRADELRGKRVAIWGFAREGRAALRLLTAHGVEPTVLDDNAEADADVPLIRGREAVAAAIGGCDVVVKSPGISLYGPLVKEAKARGVQFTSLLNLWFAEPHRAQTICVTGTKGKSTTASLIAHVLRGVGRNAALAGNIGVAVTELPADADYAVIEVSSYQAADFDGMCDVAVLTMLSQEHLDWHGSVEAYHRDKLNLLRHARQPIVNADARGLVDFACTPFDPHEKLPIASAYLARPHNMANLVATLAVMRVLGIEADAALRAAEDYAPLPHRQQELPEVGGVLFVDDSISTTPEATIAALEVYRDRPVTLILGGQDRGIDYSALVERLRTAPPVAVLLMDASGARIHELLGGGVLVASMREAVERARALTPKGGVVLLSPAAPSYGRYKSFIERGEDFARWAREGSPQT